MDKFPQMVYRHPGVEEIHGNHFATLIVYSDEELSDALASGYAETTTGALELKQFGSVADATAAPAKPLPADLPAEFPTTRDGLEELATKLGVEFKPSTSDKKLAEAIKAKVS